MSDGNLPNGVNVLNPNQEIEPAPQADLAQEAQGGQQDAASVAMSTISVQVPTGLNTFATALADLLVGIKNGVSGGNIQAAIPVLVEKLVQDLGPITSNIGNVLPALEQDPIASGIALANALQVALNSGK